MRNKIILVAVGAFGYGIFVGWAFTADSFEKKIKDKAENIEILRAKVLRSNEHKTVIEFDNDGIEYVPDDQIDENFPYTAEQLVKHPGIDYRHPYEKDPNEDNEAVVEILNGKVDEIDEDATANVREFLQGQIDHYTNGQPGLEPFIHADGEVIPRNDPPFVISKEKFAWDEEEGDNYDKLTITYYSEHRALLDDGDELVEDVDELVGWTSLAQFGGSSGDPNVVFVRNRRLRTDFEVVKEDEAPLPLHIKYGMGKEEFEVNKAAGTLRLRDEDL